MAVTYFGDNTTGTGHEGQSNNQLCSNRFTNDTKTGTLVEIGVNLYSAYTGHIRVGVYADTGSTTQPGGLLLDAGVLTNPGTGWNSVTGLSLSVTLNTIYWLSAVCDSVSPDYFVPYINSAGYVRYATHTYGPLTDPAEATSDASNRFCMRAGVEDAGGAATNIVRMII
jgi:hypothetical protein